MSRPEEIRRMFGEVERALGGLDIFVSNARPELPGFYRRFITGQITHVDGGASIVDSVWPLEIQRG